MSDLIPTLRDVQGKAAAGFVANVSDEHAAPTLVLPRFAGKPAKSHKLTSAARVKILASVALVVAVIAWPQAAGAAPKDKQPVHDFASGNPVTDAFSTLDRSDGVIASKVRTATKAGHANTLWYVIFNNPQSCSGGECGADDIFNSDGSFNGTQIQATRLVVVSAGTGAVASPGGRLKLGGVLYEGELRNGPNQLVIGSGEHGALVGLSPVSWLEDAQAAEVHIVVQDHGPAHEDPDALNMQLTRFQGACNPACEDIQFAVHLP